MTLKNEVVSISKIIFAQIPFNTVYAYADILFDVKTELLSGDESIQKQVNFLKKTTLSDLQYSDIKNLKFFKIKNRSTGEWIEISNRPPTRGELRGQILRHFLDEQKKSNPKQTVYDAISMAIKSPKYSDMVIMLQHSITGEQAKNLHGMSMTKEHFELFTITVLAKIQEKITKRTLANNFEPTAIRNDETLREIIWEGIDLNRIYDETHHASTIQKIKDMSDDLLSRGYKTAADEALELYLALDIQGNKLIAKEITLEQYKTNCNLLIDTAQTTGELKNHRGFFTNIRHIIEVMLHYMTSGSIKITPTDSIKKTNELKISLKDIVTCHTSDLEENNNKQQTIPNSTLASF